MDPNSDSLSATPEPDYEGITRRIVEAADPERVILFGSRARGDHHEDSDIDILVVMKKIENRGQLILAIRRAIGYTGVGTDILVYGTREIMQRADWSSSPISSALTEGKTLYERPRRRSKTAPAYRPA